MKKLLLLSVFAILSFLSSSNLAFSQEKQPVSDGVYSAQFVKEIVYDNMKNRPSKEYGDVEIEMVNNKIVKISSLTRIDQDEIIQKLVGTQLAFNDKGIATSYKVSGYSQNTQKKTDLDGWINYTIKVDAKNIIKEIK